VFSGGSNALLLLEGKLGGTKARNGLMVCCNHAIDSEKKQVS